MPTGQPAPGTPEPAPATTSGLGAVARVLAGVRSRARLLLLAHGLGVFIAIILGGLFLLGSLDYAIRTPGLFRAVVLLGILALAAYFGARRLIPAWKFRPSLTEVALRLERTPQGQAAGLSGVLASALELETSPNTAPSARGMIASLTRDAVDKFWKVRAPAALLAYGTVGRSGLSVLAAAAPIVLVFALAPVLADIGARRVLTPWSSAAWPKRVQLVDVTATEFHAVTAALPLRALITRTPNDPGKTDVTVRYRLLKSGRVLAERRAMLTSQGPQAPDEILALTRHERGELYERLLEPGALNPGDSESWDDGEVELEYTLRAGDDESEVTRVALVRPPAVTEAFAKITPPAYAVPYLADAAAPSAELSLGTGADSRGVSGPHLAGSRAELRFLINKDIPTPEADGTEAKAWFAAAFPGFDPPADLQSSFTAREWRLAWTLRDSVRMKVAPADRYGVTPVEDASFRIEVTQDRPPTASMLRPDSDQAVLATAVIDVVGEGKDDVALKSLELQSQRYSPEPNSQSPAPTVAGEFATITSELVTDAPAIGTDSAAARDVKIQRRAASLALEPFDLKVGEELWLTALSVDVYEDNGTPREGVRSSPRKLRIISETQLVEQVRQDLSAARQAAIRAEQDQRTIQESTENAASPEQLGENARRQGDVAERVRPPREVLDRVAQQLEQNGLQDESLGELVESARESAQRAERAAREARESLERSAQTSSDQARQDESRESRAQAEQAQAQTREELGRLIDMLEQGQDAWAARRQLEKILQEQQRLTQETAQAARETAGREASELTQEQRQQLERLAQQQQELSQRTGAAVEQMTETARQQARSNPEQAEALSRAAQRARQQRAADRQSEAAEQTRQNRTENANQLQRQAEQALQQALEELEREQNRRDERLRRQLAEVLERLEALILAQQAELDRLAPALKGDAVAALDEPMARLHASTLALVTDMSGKRETARAGEIVLNAANAQASAIGFIRKQPMEAIKVDEQERLALKLLEEARDMIRAAASQAQERDQDRKREELRKAYIEALAEQNSIIESTNPLVGKQLNRRERQRAGETGQRQEALRQSLADLREKTSDLADAGVFDFAHQRFDALMTRAAAALNTSNVTTGTARDQATAAKLLQAAADALKDSRSKRNDNFREPGGGGGGQQGGGGGQQQTPPMIPPLAELRFLRSMQQDLADRTREAAEAPNDPAAKDAARELGELQQQLSEQSKDLIERATQQGGPRQQPKDADKPADQPADPEQPKAEDPR